MPQYSDYFNLRNVNSDYYLEYRIPLYIKKTYPDYKIYLQNHWGARGLLEMHAVVDNYKYIVMKSYE